MQNESTEPEPYFSYRTVFISDIHLSSNKTAAPYLYEFLSHLDYRCLKEIYLVGDIIGGWERRSGRQEPLPEMERRILDILNYAADHDVQIHYIPGNHDEKLRPLVDRLQQRRNFGIFHPNIHFAREAVWSSSGDMPKRFKVLHGDQHDPELFVKWWFRPFTRLVSDGYDLLVTLNHHVSRWLYKRHGAHFNITGRLKSWFKGSMDYFFSHNRFLQGLEKENLDGMIMGHTHTARRHVLKNSNGNDTYLINDGDWVEDCTAAVVAKEGDLPVVIDYRIEREKYGLGDLPEEDDPHPGCFAAYRRVTDRQVRLIHRLWPARTRPEQVEKLAHAEAQYHRHTQERAALGQMMEAFEVSRVFNQSARDDLGNILNNTKRVSYNEIKNGLSALFSRYAADAPIHEEGDYFYLKTVIRQMTVRSERKIRKHGRHLSEAAAQLDMHSAARGLKVYKPRNSDYQKGV